MNNSQEKLKKIFNKNIIFGENLSKYSWFNLGGPAEIFFRPNDLDQLVRFLKEYKNYIGKLTVIGAGSNTLIRDKGVKGTILKLSSKFSYVKLINENTLEVGAATFDKKVSDFAADNSIGGFEFLSCIPGSIGGGITMNSGCYNEEISKILLSIEVIDLNGNKKEIKKEEIKFFYRGTNLPKNLIIISAKLQGKVRKREQILLKKNELINRKKISQPSNVKTCGSTFKNTIDKKAWQLIKESNSNRIEVGDAKISSKHCNFFINEGNATSAQIEELIEKVKKNIFKYTGINLELEIVIIGEKSD